MNSTWRKKALLTVGFVALTTGGVLGVTGVATASADPLPPVVETTSYPSPLPDNCPAGVGALAGVMFDNGRGGSSADLRQLDLTGGDTLTMRWTSAVDGCAAPDGQPAVAVTLAAYGTDGYAFDPSTDQPLLTTNSCGGDAGPCGVTQGSYHLSLVVPGDPNCFVQLDAVLGAPLAVVGPSGSYYTAALRGAEAPTMLIAGGTAHTESCVGNAPTPTLATSPPSPSTTAAPPTSTPVQNVSATTSPVLPPTVPSTTAAAATGASAGSATQVLAASASRAPQLPTTGAHSGVVALLGFALVVTGLGAIAAARSRFAGSAAH
jgi:hypothetical protein